ncbi:hypothetical protein KUV89_07620 [Marinobacter hydrocarbonoclasticus]|nr:hypothetical protein [Marinobacter nauticus]
MKMVARMMIFLAWLLPATGVMANEDEKASLAAKMVAPCEEKKAGEACTIVGATGIETGGNCMKHPKSGEMFCQPEGMPDSIILERVDEDVPPDPAQ